MDESACGFSVIYGINKIFNSNDITSDENIRMILVLHCFHVNVDSSVFISKVLIGPMVCIFRAKRSNKVIAVDGYFLACALVSWVFSVAICWHVLGKLN